jgi:septation ring formation regulator EzrA
MFFIKKPFQELEKRYQDMHGVFFVQCEAIFVRLEKIAKHNLEYLSYFNNLSKNREMIKLELDTKAKEQLQKLSTYVKENQGKAFTALYQPTKITLDVYESAVKKLMLELKTIMQPEDDTKIILAKVKELIRHLRSEYFNKNHQLNLVEPVFNIFFKNIDDQVVRMDQQMDMGDYDEIHTTAEKLTKAVQKVLGLLEVLPRICVLLANVIPEKIRQLTEASEQMTKQGYPLHHLLIKDTITKAGDDVERLQQRLSMLDVQGMEASLIAWSEKIESFYPLFEQEKQAKIEFDAHYEKTYHAVNELERRFTKLNSGLPRIKESYVLEHQQLQDVELLQALISKVNVTKRGLDTLVLASTRQPYSLQVDKVKLLQKEVEIGQQKMDAFSTYLISLKSQSQEAYTSVNGYFLRFKEAEKALDDLNMQVLSDQYQPLLTNFYQRLKQIIDALNVKPIDMNVVQQNLNIIKQDGQELIVQIEQKMKLALETEKLLLTANKDRHRTSDNHKIIALAEQAFFEGKFEKAHQEVQNLLKKMPIQKSGK